MDLLKLIAKSADVCLKPWIHAVVTIDPSAPAVLDDLNVRIECRDPQGERCPERDLELEIYGRAAIPFGCMEKVASDSLRLRTQDR